MKRRAKMFTVFLTGLVIGIMAANFPAATASADDFGADLSTRKFMVSVDEVKQNFVFGKEFSGSYSQTFTMSNGSKRTLELTPMVHNGMKVVELKDTGFLSYMGLNGTTTNGTLMVQVLDIAEIHRQLKEQGWRLPEQSGR